MSDAKPHCYAYPHPAVTTDVALFRYAGGTLELLLIRRARPPFQDAWALPGGFLDLDEDLDQCAARELAEETGLTSLHLEQFGCFGRPGRDPRERVVSIAFLGLIGAGEPTVRAGDDAAAAAWFGLTALPALAFDHAGIIRSAAACLLARLRDPASAAPLLPATFTAADPYLVCAGLVDALEEGRNLPL